MNSDSSLDGSLVHARGARQPGAAPVDVISVQSQLVYGHAGNSAACEPLLALGMRVAAIPTTLLSNAPVYPTTRGRVLPADWLADLLRGADERALPDRAHTLLSGYLGSLANGEVLAEWVQHTMGRCPRLRYCLDPVMGDTHTGAYVEAGLEAVFRDRLLPQAWLVTCNVFELEQLVEHECHGPDDCLIAARALLQSGPAWVVVHGIHAHAQALATLVVSATECWRIDSPYLAIDVTGAGDVLAALLVGLLVRGEPMEVAVARAIAGVHGALEATLAAQCEELVVQAAAPGALAGTVARFAARPLE